MNASMSPHFDSQFGLQHPGSVLLRFFPMILGKCMTAEAEEEEAAAATVAAPLRIDTLATRMVVLLVESCPACSESRIHDSVTIAVPLAVAFSALLESRTSATKIVHFFVGLATTDPPACSKSVVNDARGTDKVPLIQNTCPSKTLMLIRTVRMKGMWEGGEGGLQRFVLKLRCKK